MTALRSARQIAEHTRSDFLGRCCKEKRPLQHARRLFSEKGRPFKFPPPKKKWGAVILVNLKEPLLVRQLHNGGKPRRVARNCARVITGTTTPAWQGIGVLKAKGKKAPCDQILGKVQMGERGET